MTVEMAQRGADATTVLHGPSELTGGPARLVGVIVDPLTVLGPDRTWARFPFSEGLLVTETYPPLSEAAPPATQPAV